MVKTVVKLVHKFEGVQRRMLKQELTTAQGGAGLRGGVQHVAWIFLVKILAQSSGRRRATGWLFFSFRFATTVRQSNAQNAITWFLFGGGCGGCRWWHGSRTTVFVHFGCRGQRVAGFDLQQIAAN